MFFRCARILLFSQTSVLPSFPSDLYLPPPHLHPQLMALLSISSDCFYFVVENFPRSCHNVSSPVSVLSAAFFPVTIDKHTVLLSQALHLSTGPRTLSTQKHCSSKPPHPQYPLHYQFFLFSGTFYTHTRVRPPPHPPITSINMPYFLLEKNCWSYIFF